MSLSSHLVVVIISYPPYTESKLKWLKFLNGGLKLPFNKWVLLALVVAPVVAFFWYRYQNPGAARL